MRKNVLQFILRGLVAGGFGPLILVVVYLILKSQAGIESLSVNEVCTGMVSLYVLAFVAGGMNIVYQIERLPLMVAILIHGGVLYAAYLVTYLLNGWLKSGITPFLVFTAIFILGYLAVWAVIFSVTKRNTKKLNEMLKKQQESI